MKPQPVRIVDRMATRVAYLRHTGPYGAAVADFWQWRFQPFLVRQQLLGRVVYGISHDDPEVTGPEQCRFDACVEVDATWMPTSGALLAMIPGGRYGSLSFQGTPEELRPAWRTLLHDWLPASGYRLDGRPTFERYAPDAFFDADTGTFGCDLLVPLAPG